MDCVLDQTTAPVTTFSVSRSGRVAHNYPLPERLGDQVIVWDVDVGVLLRVASAIDLTPTTDVAHGRQLLDWELTLSQVSAPEVGAAESGALGAMNGTGGCTLKYSSCLC
jgi:hypothetical protein